MMHRQFVGQQSLLNNVLIPQLTQMVNNPQGFGAQGLAAMRSNLISTTGQQLQAQQQQLRQSFATQNMAGLGSGVQAALGANLAQQAAGQEAGGLSNIAIANAQAQQQQQQFGLQGLQGATQLMGAAPQSAGLANQALGQSWTMAYNQAQQGGFLQNLATGLVGGLASGLTGGLAGGLLSHIPGFGGSAPSSAAFPGFQSGNMGQPYYANTAPNPLALPSGSWGGAAQPS